ncbi:predicted protein [Uncinocarpus reesii 1704]|uniref:Uncharacterized protein n=1 Tax=Uncinocarpus reesii (strain UAMH 1704) TaxID=336963 RepID=C4JH83_UNCRE|nr:uncharacterized protein UREG_02656 [Uncinocarpus reesii 1704]EEP77807.1 predicted protein [Uncinocarpus reesii 1704]
MSVVPHASKAVCKIQESPLNRIAFAEWAVERGPDQFDNIEIQAAVLLCSLSRDCLAQQRGAQHQLARGQRHPRANHTRRRRHEQPEVENAGIASELTSVSAKDPAAELSTAYPRSRPVFPIDLTFEKKMREVTESDFGDNDGQGLWCTFDMLSIKAPQQCLRHECNDGDHRELFNAKERQRQHPTSTGYTQSLAGLLYPNMSLRQGKSSGVGIDRKRMRGDQEGHSTSAGYGYLFPETESIMEVRFSHVNALVFGQFTCLKLLNE